METELARLRKQLQEVNHDIEVMQSQPMTERQAKRMSDALDYREMLEDDIKRLKNKIKSTPRLIGVIVVSSANLFNSINLN
ncbi:MAG TPA: hypothetical protein DEG90_05040 [Porphyromonadaceae bacterium]|nr:hypothetical protein [Porphyromonadaceae bacterium]